MINAFPNNSVFPHWSFGHSYILVQWIKLGQSTNTTQCVVVLTGLRVEMKEKTLDGVGMVSYSSMSERKG